MGIYIKGIEMPKDGEHPYWVVIHSDGIVEFNENKGQGWQTSEAVPAADVVEVRHRKWTWKGHYLICSECGNESDRTNYCPNCGADMRENT